MLNKKLDLCRPCFEEARENGENLRLVKSSKDNKITCTRCGRRRFGAHYERVKKN